MAKTKDQTTGRKNKVGKISMRVTLLLFALLPLVCSSVILTIMLMTSSTKVLNKSMSNSLVSIIQGTGAAFDTATDTNETILKAYASAPVVKELLLKPNDSTLAAKAQQYTLDYFSELDGWEGLYIADWNSKVLTHPSAPVIGKVLREGDSLKALQTSILSANGVYNTGIMQSPASGQIVMSMYYPVMDGDKPIGYVGCGTLVNNVASKISDVSSLGLSSAYIYYVDSQGTMLYHPDESKIGNPVENAAVKSLVADVSAGKHPAPACIEYNYKGKIKYAAYYIGENGFNCTEYAFVTVLSNVKIPNVNVIYTNNANVKVYINGKLAKNKYVTFKVSGKTIKAKTTSKGVATLKVTLKPGTYAIQAIYGASKMTKKLTVKHLVSLNTVKVKKSAKKVVLTVKLAKKLKNKVIKFKFNGKTVKAKTNSKGIAKATFKTSALKVGKKITYSATYMKDTVKKPVKVVK
jgi:hypothetical protein